MFSKFQKYQNDFIQVYSRAKFQKNRCFQNLKKYQKTSFSKSTLALQNFKKLDVFKISKKRFFSKPCKISKQSMFSKKKNNRCFLKIAYQINDFFQVYIAKLQTTIFFNSAALQNFKKINVMKISKNTKKTIFSESKKSKFQHFKNYQKMIFSKRVGLPNFKKIDAFKISKYTKKTIFLVKKIKVFKTSKNTKKTIFSKPKKSRF